MAKVFAKPAVDSHYWIPFQRSAVCLCLIAARINNVKAPVFCSRANEKKLSVQEKMSHAYNQCVWFEAVCELKSLCFIISGKTILSQCIPSWTDFIKTKIIH